MFESRVLAALADATKEELRAVREEIKATKGELAMLQAAERVLAKRFEPDSNPANRGDKLTKEELREQIYTLLETEGGDGMRATEIGERLGVAYNKVGMICKGDEWFEKVGKCYRVARSG